MTDGPAIRAVVIGGGVTGLTAAYRLAAGLAERDPPGEETFVIRSSAWGSI